MIQLAKKIFEAGQKTRLEFVGRTPQRPDGGIGEGI